MLSKAGVEHQSIDARGKSALAQMMSLVLLGDYVSYYLSMLNEVDPSQVRAIDYIKARLAEVE
jgi:glucose/mannose-6-phosphate isomerase